MNRKTVYLLVVLFLASCASLPTGEKFKQIRPGDSAEQVTKAVGNPDAFESLNEMYVWVYHNVPTRGLKFHEGFQMGQGAADPRSFADYYVVFRHGHVVKRGFQNPRAPTNVNVNAHVTGTIDHQ